MFQLTTVRGMTLYNGREPRHETISMTRLEGKVALITGGAKGIGAATARAMAREGATVWIGDIDETNGQAVANELKANFVSLDVTKPEPWQAAIASIEDAGQGLHILVNNAGGGIIGDIESVTLDQWRWVQSLNVESIVIGIQQCMPLLKKAGHDGAIINVSSVAGLVGTPEMPAYCAAKGAVRLLTKSVALHCAPYGIRVNSVHPAFTDTPLVASLIQFGGEGMRERLEKSAPLRRLGQPEEIAAMIVYLASEEARFVTGAEMVIDGGLTAR